jgi:hypothetical protein
MNRWILAGSSVLLAWLLMQIAHELGHVLAAALTAGRVTHVELHPLAISRTDVDPNPQPLAVVWSGPLFGSLAPLVIWAIARAARWRYAFLLQFFAGFCLLANGLYLGVGSFGGIGDAGDIVNHGSPSWTLWLFGLVTVPAGLWLWDGLAPKFGWGKDAEPVPAALAYAALAALAVTAVGMVAWSALAG